MEARIVYLRFWMWLWLTGTYSYSGFCLRLNNTVSDASSTALIPNENPAFGQVLDISKSRIFRTFCNLCVSRSRKLSFEIA